MDVPISGSELKERRHALQLSQAKLARLLGVDSMTVSRWERSINVIPQYIALALEAIERREREGHPAASTIN